MRNAGWIEERRPIRNGYFCGNARGALDIGLPGAEKGPHAMVQRWPEMTQRPLVAAIWMLGSVVSFIAMAIAGRAVTPLHDTFEIMTWRSLIGLILVTTLALATGRLREARTRHLPAHLLRNVIHFTGQNLWLWALGLIPLAQLFALEFTSPVWVIVLSPLLLGERIGRLRAFAAALGFVGVLIVARPDPTSLNPGVLAAAGSAISFALSAILTKRLTQQGEGVVAILFWLTLIQFGLGLAMASLDGQIRLPVAASLPWLVVIGIAGVAAHFCLTRALMLAPASMVMPVDFLRLPLIAVIGMALYDEPLEPAVVIGAAAILAANLINLRAGNRQHSAKQAVAES